MTTRFLLFFVLSCSFLGAQVTLNRTPTRTAGQRLMTAGAPNLVEGRELYGPFSVALDAASSPPAVYVSDTWNNRVLAWRNAGSFANGAPADLVIGQRDPFSTDPLGPGTPFTSGLSQPSGLAVRNGDLYVVDSGNNRILRYPRPFSQPEPFPDLVIGQPDLGSNRGNSAGLNERSILLYNNDNDTFFRAQLAFDAEGNLYFADSGNKRVLRYPANALRPGAPNQPAADLVLGAGSFTVRPPNLEPSDPAQRLARDRLFAPVGVLVDPAGNVVVSDYDFTRPDLASRILVYAAPVASGAAAARVVQGFNAPDGLATAGNALLVADTNHHRIAILDLPAQWPQTDPAIRGVVGQADLGARLPNRGTGDALPNSLANPSGMAVLGAELFVVETGNHRVSVFPLTGLGSGSNATRLLGQEDFRRNAPNLVQGREFNFQNRTRRSASHDAGIAIDNTSDPPRLYVADTYNHRVLGFRDLRRLRAGDPADIVIGQPDLFRTGCNFPTYQADRPSETGLCRPMGLAVDPEGNLYVADSGNARVVRFPKPFEQPVQRVDLVLGQLSAVTRITDPSARTMLAPYGLAFLGDQGLWVSDVAHHRALFFPGTARTFATGMAATRVLGQPDFNTVGAGNADNRMAGPRHLAIDAERRVYVADTDNSRILIFNFDAAPANARAAVVLGTSVRGSGLRNPRGVWVNPGSGDIYVAETISNRVVRYPRLDELPLSNFQPVEAATIDLPGPVALTQDVFGSLYVADARNRIAFFFPGHASVNGANFLPERAVAPGTIVSLFPLAGGVALAPDTAATPGVPLPVTLADTQVLVNDRPAPLYYVSPTLINFVMPMNAAATGTVDVQVARASTGQTLAAGPVQMDVASPALFITGTGAPGQVAALNQDGTVNSPANAAPRGSVVQLFATGQGFINGAPPDTEGAAGPLPTGDRPRVIVGAAFVDDGDILYSGLAPGFPGLWQVNVRIPMSTAPGNAQVVLVHRGIPSGLPGQIRTSIAVRQ